MVIGLGTRLDVRMGTRLENGVLHNGQQPGSGENSFFYYSKLEAMKSLSGGNAACCDEHRFCASSMFVVKLYGFCLTIAYIARRRHSYIESLPTL